MTVEMVEQVDRVFAEANQFLEFVVAEADELLVDLPTKQYVATGQAVHDCEQVVVTLVELNTGLPGAPTFVIENCPPTWAQAMMVDIVRCGPAPNSKGVVASAKITAHSKVQSKDVAVLMGAANRRVNMRFGAVAGQILFPPPEGVYYVTRLVLQVPVS